MHVHPSEVQCFRDKIIDVDQCMLATSEDDARLHTVHLDALTTEVHVHVTVQTRMHI